MGRRGGPQLLFAKLDSEDQLHISVNITVHFDNRLSWKAKGLLWYLLTRPDNWVVRQTDLIKRSMDGRDSLYSGLAELEKHGYLERDRYARDGDGSFAGTKYTVISDPAVVGKPVSGKPVYGKPAHIVYNNLENTLSPKETGDVVVGVSSIKSTKHPINPNGGRVEDFEEVWPHFPRGTTDSGNKRTHNRSKASSAWAAACTSTGKRWKAVTRPPTKEIAIAILKRMRENKEALYWPMPETFINNGYWGNEEYTDLMAHAHAHAHAHAPGTAPALPVQPPKKFIVRQCMRLQDRVFEEYDIDFDFDRARGDLRDVWDAWDKDVHGDVARSATQWVRKWVAWIWEHRERYMNPHAQLLGTSGKMVDRFLECERGE